MRMLLVFLIIPAVVFSQAKEDLSLETLADKQIVNTENDEDNIQSIENYAQAVVHRVDLNAMSAEHLRLMGLTDLQIRNLLRHRELNGKLISIYELQSIDGFDLETIRHLQRICLVKDPASTIDGDFFKRIKTDAMNYVLIRNDYVLEQRKGFSNSVETPQQFEGPPIRTSFRIRSFRAADFSFGLTAENDAGEKFRWKPAASYYGFDYIAVHAQVQNKRFIKNLILGDYQAQFGQGLVWGNAMGFGKGAETITNIRRSNIGFVPYTSAYESGYFHGGATTLTIKKNFNLSLMLSANKRDASISEISSGKKFTTAFQTTGLHRNAAEIEKRKVVNQNFAGAALDYNKGNLIIGTTLQLMNLNMDLNPRTNLYNQFSFRGNQNMNGSAFLNYTYNNVSFFSELATTIGKGNALVIGSLISLTPKFDLSFLFRKYDRDYWPFFSNAFSESTTPNNEKGLYWGWKYKLNRKFYASAYVDLFSFDWMRYRSYAPSQGFEWLAHLHWQPSRTTTVFFQLRQESKSRNAPATDQNLYQLNNIVKNSYWLHAEFYLSPTMRMKTRIQWSNFLQDRFTSEGFAVAQDFSITKGKLKATVRYALFDTDDYDNRQYFYENDVWLAYSLPAYAGKGIRKYLLVQYKFNKTFTVWLKYSHTHFMNKDTLGSGLETIYGNQQNDLKFEARIQF